MVMYFCKWQGLPGLERVAETMALFSSYWQLNFICVPFCRRHKFDCIVRVFQENSTSKFVPNFYHSPSISLFVRILDIRRARIKELILINRMNGRKHHDTEANFLMLSTTNVRIISSTQPIQTVAVSFFISICLLRVCCVYAGYIVRIFSVWQNTKHFTVDSFPLRIL